MLLALFAAFVLQQREIAGGNRQVIYVVKVRTRDGSVREQEVSESDVKAGKYAIAKETTNERRSDVKSPSRQGIRSTGESVILVSGSIANMI